MTSYPKRLIEVDLPIKRISAHARREKEMRKGHVPQMYIWPATRPLAACRAVICASLWPDPADPLCPQTFRDKAAQLITEFAKQAATDNDLANSCAPETWAKWQVLAKAENRLDPAKESHKNILRNALLDFIADFANWDNSTNEAYLKTSRALTESAHVALGGEPGTRPLVVDPFAGGGAIPLEALRVGADAFASDLNPVAVLLNKVLLEYIPKYGQRLADEVRKWGAWVKQEAQKELAEFYPKDPDGATPIAYLWARTIVCEGPGCGAEVPLMRSMWLAKKGGRQIALRIVPNKQDKRIEFEIIEKKEKEWVEKNAPHTVLLNPRFDGTVKRGSATCPLCDYTTPVTTVRRQLKERRGGTTSARLFCVVTMRSDEQGRSYRLPNESDLKAITCAANLLEKHKRQNQNLLSLVPSEPLPPQGALGFRVQLYGMTQWDDLFTPRQLLALTTISKLVKRYISTLVQKDSSYADAVGCTLSLAVNKLADLNASLCGWQLNTPNAAHVFTRWALPFVFDFAEVNLLAGAGGSPESVVKRLANGIEDIAEANMHIGQANNSSATNHPLPDDSVNFFVTDPPYYDAVGYADLSDFFYVWLKRTLSSDAALSFSSLLAPKEAECIVDEVRGKDRTYFERTMGEAMAEGRRVLHPAGVGLVVFAHKSTSGWEAQLQAMMDAGWTMTGSWPIDTEMGSRLRAQGSAALASSVHLVCRPRENADGSLRADEVGDWRDVLQELPRRIHEWMPRLAAEGVVGADAIFACLGPALEIFSRYARVEKASGEAVTLREYLEHVWAAVAKEALQMIFAGADATGFEEDARLTAMWLWTLNANADGTSQNAGLDDDGAEDDEDSGGAKKAASGYTLEFDAARKIAQGLGAILEKLPSVVEVKGDKARLLPVAERARFLFGQADLNAPPKRRKHDPQVELFDLGKLIVEDGGAPLTLKAGQTALDRVHQSMVLFSAGRGEALKRFLVEDGIGSDQRFWRLAQALSALYPASSDEKRWVDGVLARKKGLGF